ncbi:MAG: hypothetical protein JHC95_04640 [Solirubrobacteraceae bacterium]|nr:hypothetical protein [Solirubrobacteraceae bacterium]
MAIRVNFAGGGEAVLEGETLGGLREHLDGESGNYIHYPKEGILVVVGQITHAEDLDKEMPAVEVGY